MTGAEIVLLVAVILGPIFGVVVALCMESRRAQREQRMNIFRALMRTRVGTARMSADHVAALNLVEIEFWKDKAVHDAWKKHLDILSGRKETGDHLVLEKSLANLIQLISRNLGYKIEGLEIFEGGYTPKSDADWHIIRKYVIDLSLGERVLPVKVLESTTPQEDR